MNFILLCVNEYGSLDRSKNTIIIMNGYISDTQEMILRLEEKIEGLEEHINGLKDE
tara:strand:+ start:92 stop:259 length:168 start_codon:yes stop_codon:yes gene_type:complete